MPVNMVKFIRRKSPDGTDLGLFPRRLDSSGARVIRVATQDWQSVGSLPQQIERIREDARWLSESYIGVAYEGSPSDLWWKSEINVPALDGHPSSIETKRSPFWKKFRGGERE